MSVSFRRFDPEGISEHNQPLLFEDLLLIEGFTPEQIQDIWRAYDKVCHSCFDGDIRCQCWNDE